LHALLYAHRAFTSLPATVSEEDRQKYECVITIYPNGTSSLNSNFEAEIARALARLRALP
jgi:hypothetical protein